MATIDKKGNIRGSIGPNVYRTWRGIKVIQSKPKRKAKRTIGSKEASLEFGLCSMTARVMRQAFGWAYKAYDGGMINRFTKAVRSAVSASTKERGDRDIHDADLSFLKGFQFNNNSPLDKVLKLRPTAELSADNKITVQLPPVAAKDIKQPNIELFGLRILVIAFDFRKRVYSNIASREIQLTSTKAFEGGTISFDETLPEGRLVAVSLSIFGYENSFSGGIETTNTVQWNPAEILNLWQLPIPEGNNTTITEEIVNPPYKNEVMVYDGPDIFNRIAWLRKKTVQTKKPLVRPPAPKASPAPDLPKGDISF